MAGIHKTKHKSVAQTVEAAASAAGVVAGATKTAAASAAGKTATAAANAVNSMAAAAGLAAGSMTAASTAAAAAGAGTATARKADRRIARTRKAIMDAFDSLLAKKGYERITVSAIAREADIDRKTFYLHYSSIEDLSERKLEGYLTRIAEAVERDMGSTTGPERTHRGLQELNTIVEENKASFTMIANNMSIEQILGLTEKALSGLIRDTYPAQTPEEQLHTWMVAEFYMAGTISLYANWLASGSEIPIDHVSAIAEEAMLSRPQ